MSWIGMVHKKEEASYTTGLSKVLRKHQLSLDHRAKLGFQIGHDLETVGTLSYTMPACGSKQSSVNNDV